MKMDQLPQAVQQAFKTQADEFNVENIKKQTKEGQTAYQGSFDHGNMRTHLTIAEDGSILGMQQARDFGLGAVLPETSVEQQQQTKLEDLPQLVQETIKKVSGPKLQGITKEMINEKTVYRAGFNQGAIHSDVFIAENGDIVAQGNEQ